MEENKSHVASMFFAQRKNIYTSISGASSSNFKIFRACKDQQEPSLLFVPQCYNHLICKNTCNTVQYMGLTDLPMILCL